MRFKNPGGELSWLTPLLFLGGSYLAYVFYREGSTAMAVVSGLLGLFSLLVWFDMKWVALPLIGWFFLVIIASVLVLVFKEFSWRTAIRVPAFGFTIYSLWEWYRRVDPEDIDPAMAELERLTTAYRPYPFDEPDSDHDSVAAEERGDPRSTAGRPPY